MSVINPSAYFASLSHIKLRPVGQPVPSDVATKPLGNPTPVNPGAASNPQPPVRTQIVPVVDTAQKPPTIEELLAKSFDKFDTDGNGLVTKEEIIAKLQAAGRDEAYIKSFVENLLSPTSDVNGDGLSFVEVQRRLAIGTGDHFAEFDFDLDGKITQEELGQGVALYSQYLPNFDANKAYEIFKTADSDHDGILTKEEFAAYDPNQGGTTVANTDPVGSTPTGTVAGYNPASEDIIPTGNTGGVTTSPVKEIRPAGIPITPSPVSATPPTDSGTLKPQLPNYSAVELESQLFLLLQNQS